MFKKLSISLLCSTAAATISFAGLIDNGDTFNQPDTDSFLLSIKIAEKHFPETTHLHPHGHSRQMSWLLDIHAAAKDLDIDKEALLKLMEFVFDPFNAQIVAAPHPKLLEFELYARGKRELIDREYTAMTPSWQRLLALPIEQRRYTTIPVLRAFSTYIEYHLGSLKDQEKLYLEMLKAKEQGCFDTQGCILDSVIQADPNPTRYGDFTTAFRHLARKASMNNRYVEAKYEKEKLPLPATYKTNRGFIRWKARINLRHALYIAPDKQIRFMCEHDPVMRDFIIRLALTNRTMGRIRKIAMKYLDKSVINHPVAALRLPYEQAVMLLQPLPEFHDLRDQLTIKQLSGEAKVAAIDKYIATYKDFAADPEAKKGITLYSHAQLNALAGAELFKMGKPLEAAERWINGCSPEDMGIVAEQVMSIDELKSFCDRHFPQPEKNDQKIYSTDCTKGHNLWGVNMLTKPQLNFMLRNLLARRLMRAGRFAEAQKYFTGTKTRALAEKFFAMQQSAANPAAGEQVKLTATLNMAALVRFHGDKLFGTFLEPDNLICNNNFPCSWGSRQSYVKLNKEKLPRYSYRFRAAKLYAEAAAMTTSYNLKSYALWTAGTIIKNLSPKTADPYFKQLYGIAPELTEKNWFLPIKKSPQELLDFYRRREFSARH